MFENIERVRTEKSKQPTEFDDQTLETANSFFNSEKERGYQLGFKQGFEDGFKKGSSDGKTAVESAEKSLAIELARLSETFAGPCKQFDEALSNQILDAFSQILYKLSPCIIKDGQEKWQDQLLKTLQSCSANDSMKTLIVNPDNAPIAEKIARNKPEYIQVQCDPSLSINSFELQFGKSKYSYSFQNEIDNLIDKLLGK